MSFEIERPDKSFGEIVAELDEKSNSGQVPVLSAVAFVGLFTGSVLLTVGRSVIGHLFGFVAAGVAAPIATSFASRIVSLRQRGATLSMRTLALLAIANLGGATIAVFHALYVVRRVL